jgi:hypothetical protein
MPRDMSRVGRLMADVPDSDVNLHAFVKPALQELAAAQRARAPDVAKVRQKEAELNLIDTRLLAATERVGRLRERMPAIAASILLGAKAPLQAEAQLFAEIAAEERVIERTKLGRPFLEADLRALRGVALQRAAVVVEAEERLERARGRARRDLAEQLVLKGA